MMAMQTCQTYAEKLAGGGTLTEYEVEVYEQMARLVASWCKAHEMMARRQFPEIERSLYKEEQEHAEWLMANQDEPEPERDLPEHKKPKPKKPDADEPEKAKE